MKSISVLLSVFGNSPYLPDFLSSLKNQTCGNFQLVYRQDGEGDVDDTLFNFNDSVHLTNSEHFGVVKSYNQLIAKAPDSDYYMFADQDDIWYQDKIEVSRNAIQQAEDIFGANTPILIHSDLRVVDSNLKTISKSFVRYQSLKPCKNDLKDLIIQNNATGCTMIFNRALRNIADIPEDAICHDWYMALIAAAFGKIIFLDCPLIDYRQHSCNFYGAMPRKKLMEKFFQRKNLHYRIRLTQKQARLFALQFEKQLSEEQLCILKLWSDNLNESSYLRKLFSTWKAGFRKNDWLRTIGMWWAL